VLALALLGVAFIPLAGNASGPPAAACAGPACQAPASPQRWAVPLTGSWAVGSGLAGTYPLSGQAYVAAGDGVAAVGDGLTVSAYRLATGALAWQETLGGFGPGAAVMSVRAWPGVVTAGVAGRGGTRTEVVLDAGTGVPLRRYPAALFGGTVAASATTTIVIGTSSVTSYDNRTGKVRWQRPADSRQAWRTDGDDLYITESAGGYLAGAPVTGLRVIDLATDNERTLSSPASSPFRGTLAGVVAGVVIFSAPDGVSAYSGATGALLWTRGGVVPEGTDPGEGLAYFTSASGSLLGLSPLTGRVTRSVSGATAPGGGGLYVVRGGVALGLDSGASGQAWGYSLVAGRVTWTAAGLPWPHYFADVSGIGGSAATVGDTVVIAACGRLAPAPTATLSTSPAASSPAASSPAAPTPTAPTLTAPGSVTPASALPATGPPARSPASPGTSPARSPSTVPAPTLTPTSASPAPGATPSATPSPPQECASPLLVALNL
jgi:hypothetical protein